MYARELSQTFGLHRNTVLTHLRKLEEIGLIERHGNPRCPYQWWSVPETLKDKVAESITALESLFRGKTAKETNYAVLKILPIEVPMGRLKMVSFYNSTVILPALQARKKPDPEHIMQFQANLQIPVESSLLSPENTADQLLGRPAGGSIPWSLKVQQQPHIALCEGIAARDFSGIAAVRYCLGDCPKKTQNGG